MLGIIVATHGKMSDGLVDAVNLILGETNNVETLNLYQGDDIDNLNKQMVEAINKVDQGDGVVIFTDLFGASPYNQATLAINSLPEDKKNDVHVITGVNLPMLLEAINQQMLNTPVKETVDMIVNTAKDSVVTWSAAEIDTEDDDDDF